MSNSILLGLMKFAQAPRVYEELDNGADVNACDNNVL
jgi:hypothetical protein